MNEELEIVGTNDDSEVPTEIGGEEMPVEEKYEELKEKVGELYAMINGEEGEEELEAEPEIGGEEIPVDEPEIGGEEGEDEIELGESKKIRSKIR